MTDTDNKLEDYSKLRDTAERMYLALDEARRVCVERGAHHSARLCEEAQADYRRWQRQRNEP